MITPLLSMGDLEVYLPDAPIQINSFISHNLSAIALWGILNEVSSP